MSRCSPIFREIYYPDCKIIMFKVKEQVLSKTLPKAEISSPSNFQKICFCFLVGEFSIYGS